MYVVQGTAAVVTAIGLWWLMPRARRNAPFLQQERTQALDTANARALSAAEYDLGWREWSDFIRYNPGPRDAIGGGTSSHS